jgi:hypothetical protein
LKNLRHLFRTTLFPELATAIHETSSAPIDNFGLIKIAKTIGFPLTWESDFLRKKKTKISNNLALAISRACE